MHGAFEVIALIAREIPVLNDVHDPLRILHHAGALFGENDTLLGARQQRIIQFILQLVDGDAQGRLCDIQVMSSFVDRLAIGNFY